MCEKFSHWKDVGSLRPLRDQTTELGLWLSNRAVNAWKGEGKNDFSIELTGPCRTWVLAKALE